MKITATKFSFSSSHYLQYKTDLFYAARAKQLVMTSGSEPLFHGTRGTLLGFEPSLEIVSASSSKELRRIGKIRMTWEESVSLWAEEGEHLRGRVRLQGSSFLKADELSFFDDVMVPSTMEAFEDGPLRGFSVDRFVSGQQIKVFGRRKSSPSAASSGTTKICWSIFLLFYTIYEND